MPKKSENEIELINFDLDFLDDLITTLAYLKKFPIDVALAFGIPKEYFTKEDRKMSVIDMQQCKQLSIDTAEIGGYSQSGLGSERTWPRCSCQAYKFRRNGETIFGGENVPNFCKHIRRALNKRCSWHQLTGMQQKDKGVCPICGGPTETVRVKV